MKGSKDLDVAVRNVLHHVGKVTRLLESIGVTVQAVNSPTPENTVPFVRDMEQAGPAVAELLTALGGVEALVWLALGEEKEPLPPVEAGGQQTFRRVAGVDEIKKEGGHG